MDKIIIRELKIFAYHGVNPEEKANGQLFILDMDLGVDISAPCKSDNVEDTVNYAEVIYEATRIFTSQKDDLIERAAERVAQGLFEKFKAIKTLKILLKKPDAPIEADFGYVGVEITRERKD